MTRVDHDPKAHAYYVRLRRFKVGRLAQVFIGQNVIADVDRLGRVVGFEVIEMCPVVGTNSTTSSTVTIDWKRG